MRFGAASNGSQVNILPFSQTDSTEFIDFLSYYHVVRRRARRFRIASDIFRGLKSRHPDCEIVRMTCQTTRDGHNAWKIAYTVTTNAVWLILLRDCVIPQQSVWLDRIETEFSDGKATETNLSAFAKSLGSYRSHIKGLTETSPVPEGIHSEIWAVIQSDSALLFRLLRSIAQERSERLMVANEVADMITPVIQQTKEKLQALLPVAHERIDAIEATQGLDDGSSRLSLSQMQSEPTLSIAPSSVASASGQTSCTGEVWSTRRAQKSAGTRVWYR